MIRWQIHQKAETASTNLDARAGGHGDVFVADFQTAGRGRLDHKWLSPPGANLMMSAVLSVAGLSCEAVSTFPLVVGLAVVRAVRGLLPAEVARTVLLKWPNDVLVGGRKVAGILCERDGERVIVGIGINVKQREFPQEIAKKAISLGSVPGFPVGAVPSSSLGAVPGFPVGSVPSSSGPVPLVRDAVLAALNDSYADWRERGFAAVYPQVCAVDFLRGQALAVRQTDEDAQPVRGICRGIQSDGSLLVGDVRVYAGEAHVEEIVGEACPQAT